jgi:hypothetical protein
VRLFNRGKTLPLFSRVEFVKLFFPFEHRVLKEKGGRFMRIRFLGNSIGLALLVLLVFSTTVHAQDADGDGMPDVYENMYGCLMPNTVNSGVDYDADGLTSLQEYNYSDQLNPCLPDTDSDGAWDGFEISHGSNPLDFRVRPMLNNFFQVLIPETRVTTMIMADNSSLLWTGSSFGPAWVDNRFSNYEVFFEPLSLRGNTLGPLTRVDPGVMSRSPELVLNNYRGQSFSLKFIPGNHSSPGQNITMSLRS